MFADNAQEEVKSVRLGAVLQVDMGQPLEVFQVKLRGRIDRFEETDDPIHLLGLALGLIDSQELLIDRDRSLNLVRKEGEALLVAFDRLGVILGPLSGQGLAPHTPSPWRALGRPGGA